ncbi:flagellar biosynthesis protein FliQ [Fusibacter sp. JL216-2]|uniref:flagellar biosynthesis protein FliQ n=1 Tax=Fusibacter sp. JL216-2 TaxID=3071453 RepID=UPI003D343836
MDQGMVVDIFTLALKTILLLAAPMLLSALTVGLIVAVFQATTQIQEQTLAFVPKILAVFLVLMAAGPWLLQNLMSMTMTIFGYIDKIILK